MTFANGEVTHYREDGDFADYLLGVRAHRGEHADPAKVSVSAVESGAVRRFDIDYADEAERARLADFLQERLEESPAALLSFRADFPEGAPFEPDGAAEADLAEVERLVVEFSLKTRTTGFLVEHLGQTDADGQPIPPHVHFVYEDFPEEPLFSEYLQAHLQ